MQAALESAITNKTKMLMLNSPNNPSGSIFTEEEYLEFSKVLLKYPDIIIVSDEIYEHINYGVKSVSFASLPGMYDRTVTVNGISKAFAMTGWRIGYLAAPKIIAKACNKMQGQITSGANCIAQRATIKALEESPDKIKYMVDEFKIRRDLIIDHVSKIDGFKIDQPPPGAFYIFPDISKLFGKEFSGVKVNNANDLSMLILEKAFVATVPGDAFGYPNCIRISYSTSREQIVEAIKRIKELLT
jgi:aspartate aminotransferase